MKHIIIITIVVFSTNFSSLGQSIDTLEVFERSSPISIDTILDYLYSDKTFLLKNYSIANIQDVMPLFFDRSNVYLKIYNKKRRLVIEGLKNIHCRFEKEIIYYYNNGNIERIEYWHDKLIFHVGNNIVFAGSMSYKPEGEWKYFSKKGNLIKTVDYRMGEFPIDNDPCYYSITKYFQNDTIQNPVLKKISCN